MKEIAIKIKKPNYAQVIIGHAGFIKTVEDLYEAMANSAPEIKFGVAFVEASGPCLVRGEGNDAELSNIAKKDALEIGAGHTFVILFANAYPINVVNRIKDVDEVTEIYCATANEVEVIVAETKLGRAVIGVVDGKSGKGIESESDKMKRRKLLRDIGYKL